jgi:hypothetical protein
VRRRRTRRKREKGKFDRIADLLERAIDEARKDGNLGQNVLGSNADLWRFHGEGESPKAGSAHAVTF